MILKLKECGIHYVGTIRPPRLPNCNLAEKKEMKKKGRGNFDSRVERTHNIVAVRWFDNRAVTLVSSFTGPQPIDKVRRWDKRTKTYVEVDRPSIVGVYNQFMGGIE